MTIRRSAGEWQASYVVPMLDPITIKERVLRHDRAVPRYTSYPTAPQFQADFPAATQTTWLDGLQDGSALSLYVHIPYCPQLCTYCGCFTRITTRYAPVEDYLHLLRREIQQMGARLGQKQRVTHLHFGGGSPTMLLPKDFALLVATLRENFRITDASEIAVEIDPRAVTAELAAVYADAGVNRISLGVQDFDDQVMTAVNRRQPFEVVYRARQMLGEAGIAACNLDFIYGLPYQTVRSLTRTMDYALLLNPQRIALYGYAHVPWKKRNIRLVPEAALPDASLRYDLFQTASGVLESAGLVPLGIDHFARPDDPMALAAGAAKLGRNFQGYTDQAPDALLGFGQSAISQFPQGYTQNTLDSGTYEQAMLHGQTALAKGYAFNGEDQARKAIIDTLMTMLRVDAAAIWSAHGHDPATLRVALLRLQPLQQDGLLTVQDGVISLPLAARPVVRLAAAAFDAYLPTQEDTPRHARAV